MATHRIPIVGFGARPDDSGDVFFEPYDIKATNDNWKRLVLIFNDTSTKIALEAGFTVPKDYSSATTDPKLIVVWTATATSGSVVFDADLRAVGGNDSESLDQATAQESVTVTDIAPGAIHRRLEASLTLTRANYAADDEVTFQLFRDGVDASDTMAAAAIVFALLLEYDDV